MLSIVCLELENGLKNKDCGIISTNLLHFVNNSRKKSKHNLVWIVLRLHLRKLQAPGLPAKTYNCNIIQLHRENKSYSF